MTIVLMIIFVFTFIPLALAEFARANSLPTVEDFFLQSRKMPLFMVFFTVYATWVSSFAFLGSTTSFYSNGPLYMTCFAWNVLFGLLFMIIGKRIWFYGRLYKCITAADFFDGIFKSRQLNVSVTVISALFTLPYLMIQLYGGAYIIETVSGGLIPWRAAGLVFYLVIIIYLWAGGVRALAMTDVFYGLVVFFSMLAAGFILIGKTDGVERTYQLIMQRDAADVVLGSGLSSNSPWAWLCMFVVIPLGALMGPPLWIRIYSVKEEKIFNTMPLLLALVTIMYLGPLLMAAAAKIMYPSLSQNDNMIPYILVNNLPIIAATLLLCGIAAAALSTANSQIHAMAAIYTVDIHKRYINPNTSNWQLVSISKWAILFLSALAYALMLKNPGMIIETGTLGMGGTAQLIVPTLGALFWEKSNDKAAVTGLLAGVAILCSLCFICHIAVVYAAAIALSVNAALFFIISRLSRPNVEVQARIVNCKQSFYKR